MSSAGTSTGTVWICERCSTNNTDLNAGVCIVCGTSRRLNGFLNNRPSVPGECDKHVSNSTTWTCTRCTFDNPAANKQCEMCTNVQQNVTVGPPARPPPPASVTPPRARPRTAVRSISSLSTPSSIPADFTEDLAAIQELESHETLSAIRAHCRELRENFVDDTFPPCERSVGRLPVHNGQHRQQFSNGAPRPIVAEWRRAMHCHSRQPTPHTSQVPLQVCRTPLPSDICQGILGNCWLLSAIAVVAERSQLIERILVTQNVNAEGAYQVRLCVDGVWRVVLIDDYLPVDCYGRLVFSETRRRQLWVSLIEKACAKVRGSYAALIAGRTLEGLATLTGAPCETIHLRASQTDEEFDLDLVWARLVSARDAGFLIGASCGNGNEDLDEALWTSMGLQPHHAYSVLNVRHIVTSETDSTRLLQLRNPWGHFSWNGAYSDRWNGWSTALRHELLPRGAEEGIFWMPFGDFCGYFDCVDVCKARLDWCEQRLEGQLQSHARSGHFYMYRLVVSEPTEVAFTLYQHESRHANLESESTLDLCLIVSQEKDHKRSLAGFTCATKRDIKPFVTTDSVLQPGAYLICAVALNHWGVKREDKPPKCVVATHSQANVQLSRFSAPTSLLADSLIALVLARGESHPGRDHVGLHYYNHGGLIVLVENWHDDACVVIQCDCTGSANVVSSRASLLTADVIPPLHRQIICALTHLEPHSPYYITHHLKHSVTYTGGLGPRFALPGVSVTSNHAPPITDDHSGLHSPRPIL